MSAKSAIIFLSLILCYVAVGVFGEKGKEERGGCAGFGTCCPGKNISCVGRGPSQSNKTSERCFCDEDCLQIADCCLDYRFICKSVNCLLSDQWSEWTECDRKCGTGTQRRTRKILVRPRNGGKKCSDHIERRMCEGHHCKITAVHKKGFHEDPKIVTEQTANIVPAVFAPWRTNVLYNPLQGIRQSLFLHHLKYASLFKEKKPSYCAIFKVTETRSACHRRGIISSSSSSSAEVKQLTSGQQQQQHQQQTKVLTVGREICVECQPFGILQQTMSDKCVGDGVFQVETNWNAVTAPGCHGKWILISEHQVPCHCDQINETSFIFV